MKVSETIRQTSILNNGNKYSVTAKINYEDETIVILNDGKYSKIQKTNISEKIDFIRAQCELLVSIISDARDLLESQ